MAAKKMKKYMVVYQATAGAKAKLHKGTPKEQKEHMKAWMKWQKDCGKHMVEPGNPFGKGKKVEKGSSSDLKSTGLGYCIMKAENFTQLRKLLNKNPFLGKAKGCSLDVIELISMKK